MGAGRRRAPGASCEYCASLVPGAGGGVSEPATAGLGRAGGHDPFGPAAFQEPDELVSAQRLALEEVARRRAQCGEPALEETRDPRALLRADAPEPQTHL